MNEQSVVTVFFRVYNLPTIRCFGNTMKDRTKSDINIFSLTIKLLLYTWRRQSFSLWSLLIFLFIIDNRGIIYPKLNNHVQNIFRLYIVKLLKIFSILMHSCLVFLIHTLNPHFL